MRHLAVGTCGLWLLGGVALASPLTHYEGPRFERHRTANGELYDSTKATCASRRYPLGTVLRIRDGYHTVLAPVTDLTAKRFSARTDCSPAVFRHFAPLSTGMVDVAIEVAYWRPKKHGR